MNFAGPTSYTFDAANRMTQVAGKESYRYDGHGRRVKVTIANGQTDYPVYDLSGRLLSEDDARSNQSSDYVSLNGSLVAIRRASLGGTNWTTAYEHTDALRSPVHETDANANPTTRGTQWFTPFGEPGNGSYLQGPGYTGHISDAASHLTYAQQRYYDPVLGRFLSPDPVQADDKGGDFNRYWYAGNNPYKFTDPDGRAFFVDDGIGIGVGAALGIGKEEFVDLVFKRRLPTYGEFWGSAVSGGIDGEAVVNAPESMGGTLVFAAGAGAAGSSVRQLIDGGHVSASETVKDSVLSAATAGVGRKLIPETGINEWTKGRGNFASMYKGLLTKMERGQIKTMSTKSALKGVAGRQAADLYKSAAGSAVDALKSIFSSSDRAVDQQEHCNGSCTSGGGVTITP